MSRRKLTRLLKYQLLIRWNSNCEYLRLIDLCNVQFLMVNTSDDKTSCTLRLSMYNLHGKVLTDDVFGVFKFSPDGK